MSAIRPEILALEQNGITALALPRLTDPTVIPLWIGEGDTATPKFIRDAAKQAMSRPHSCPFARMMIPWLWWADSQRPLP